METDRSTSRPTSSSSRSPHRGSSSVLSMSSPTSDLVLNCRSKKRVGRGGSKSGSSKNATVLLLSPSSCKIAQESIPTLSPLLQSNPVSNFSSSPSRLLKHLSNPLRIRRGNVMTSSSVDGSLVTDSSSDESVPCTTTMPKRIIARSKGNATTTTTTASCNRATEKVATTKTAVEVETIKNWHLMEWLSTSCPDVLVGRILAFAGPQQSSALAQSNRHWRCVMQQEETWRILCEELYKWYPGDAIPSSWKEHYASHPCVPIDFPTIQAALDGTAASTDDDSLVVVHDFGRNGDDTRTIKQQVRNICILVRPGEHVIADAIHIETTNRMLEISIEAIRMPSWYNEFVRQRKIRQRSFLGDSHAQDVLSRSRLMDYDYDDEDLINLTRVKLVSRFRIRNEPLIRVVRGSLRMHKIHVQHQSLGVDLWNGNAAIMIRPNSASDTIGASRVTMPKAQIIMDECEVVSYSGRGIVALDYGHVHLTNCYVHDCAATGLYIGGRSTMAVLRQCDISRNGTGNQRTGGITRGHSGLYLEQGLVDVVQCNISNNTAAGISVISQEFATLRMRDCDVLSNGFSALEIPTENIHRHSIDGSNHLGLGGQQRPRSTVYQAILQLQDEADDMFFEFAETASDVENNQAYMDSPMMSTQMYY